MGTKLVEDHDKLSPVHGCSVTLWSAASNPIHRCAMALHPSEVGIKRIQMIFLCPDHGQESSRQGRGTCPAMISSGTKQGHL